MLVPSNTNTLPPSLLSALFPSSQAPSNPTQIPLLIAFGPSGSKAVSSGNRLTIEDVKEFPQEVNFMGDEGKGYSLVLLDPGKFFSQTGKRQLSARRKFRPISYVLHTTRYGHDVDAPSAASPTSRAFLHLILPNLTPLSPDDLISQASSLSPSQQASRSPSTVKLPDLKDALMPWRPPGPGQGSGVHRYGTLPSPSASLCFFSRHLRTGQKRGTHIELWFRPIVRIVFALVEQPQPSVTFPPDHLLRNGEPEGRRHFDLTRFVEETLGGGKVAGMDWFEVEG
jgi:hypothetical protein